MKRKDLTLNVIEQLRGNRTESGVRGQFRFRIITSLGYSLLICKMKILLIPASHTSENCGREKLDKGKEQAL
jgi:hypothetical protein